MAPVFSGGSAIDEQHAGIARSKTPSLVAMTCWQAARNVDRATSVGDLEEAGAMCC